MVYEINYATPNFYIAQERHEKAAKKRGKFDKVICYREDILDTEFVNENKQILSYKKGGGYWIWKPYIINKTLDIMKDGDYLFYCDSGAIIRHSINKLIRVMENNHEDIMVFEVFDHKEISWTKRDVFIYFDYETEECLNSNQIMSGFILIKKNEKTVKIFREYQRACLYKHMITDAENELGVDNYSEFIEHRHDQSILSVLLKKNGIKSYREPSQFGMYQHAKYVQQQLSKEELSVYKRSKYPLLMFLLHRNSGLNESKNIHKWYLRQYYAIFREYLQYWKDWSKKI